MKAAKIAMEAAVVAARTFGVRQPPPAIAPLVLLASVLKPVDDTRMLGKFARTLAAAGLRVAVAGRASAGAAAPAGVSLHSLLAAEGSRMSLGRLSAQRRYWQLLRQLQPAVVVVHAPELLPLTLLWQRLGPGRQFIYDIRENYALNITTQAVYRGAVRRTLATTLRRVEALAARRAAALTLAEASYAQELPFLAGRPAPRVLLLENKYQTTPGEVLAAAPRPLPSQSLRLLYTGTISELNGVREALALTEALRPLWPGGAGLTIAGYCQRPALLAEIQGWEAAGRPVRLLGGAAPLPHSAVVTAVTEAHLGLALYRPHPSTARCRPTKLFEYLAHSLPVLVPDNPLWSSLILAHGAGLVWAEGEPLAALAARVAAALAPGGTAFYSQGSPADVLWASEGKKLRHLLETMLPGFTFAPVRP